MYDVFVISPYTHDNPVVVQERVEKAETFLVNLTLEGKIAYSTIVAMHHLTKNHTLPTNYAFWRNHCRTMIASAKEVYVLCLDGWKESTGVADEIKIATELHKNITYINNDRNDPVNLDDYIFDTPYHVQGDEGCQAMEEDYWGCWGKRISDNRSFYGQGNTPEEATEALKRNIRDPNYNSKQN